MTTQSAKVLLIARDFPPDFSPGSPRIERFARNLPEFGWLPLILALDQGSDYGSPTSADPFLESLTITRCPMGTSDAQKSAPAKPASDGETNATRTPSPASSPLRRLVRPLRRGIGNFRDLLFATPDQSIGWVRPAVAAGEQMIQEQRPQAIFTSGPPHSIHLIGRRLKRATGLPWVADFRDPWARRPWGAKKHNPWGQKLYPYLERKCIAAADRVILNTDNMLQEFRRHYPQWSEKFLAIPNGCDAHLVAIAERLVAEAPAHQTGETITLVHAGSLYRQRDPRSLIQAVGLLNQRGVAVRFEQIGNCHQDFGVPEMLQDRQYGDSVSLTPPVARDEALRRTANADLLLLIQPGTDLQIPGKLFEMLPFRKPILAITDQGATADVVAKHRLGAVAADHSPQGIARVLEELVHCVENADDDFGFDAAMREYDGRALTSRLASTLDELRSGSGPSDTNREDEHYDEGRTDSGSRSTTSLSENNNIDQPVVKCND